MKGDLERSQFYGIYRQGDPYIDPETEEALRQYRERKEKKEKKKKKEEEAKKREEELMRKVAADAAARDAPHVCDTASSREVRTQSLSLE